MTVQTYPDATLEFDNQAAKGTITVNGVEVPLRYSDTVTTGVHAWVLAFLSAALC